jgi:type II secretory pathway predicted ATPase ExeA
MKMPSSTGIDRPFPCVPMSDRYLAIGSIEDARSRICRMIERSEGLGVIIGPPGTGKTLLCQRIAAQYRNSHAVVMLGDIRVSSRMGLIQQVLFHLRVPHRDLDEQAMQLALVETLTKGSDGARSLLLLIDEAQMLSAELLDEIRMLTNLIRDGRPMVQTVLVGSPRMEDALADPQMESLTQRIGARCYLHPMNHAETSQYIRSMLAATGMQVSDDAIASVYHACGGVPRLINQLMNQSVDFASLHRRSMIDDHSVQHAWADLQQLPSPILEPKLKPAAAIEFGDLDGAAEPRTMDSQNMKNEVRMPMPAEKTPEFMFENFTDSVLPNYVDMESILSSPIVCLGNAVDGSPQSQPSSEIGDSSKALPTQLKTSHTTIPTISKSSARKINREELFGIDFSDEMLVEVKLADVVTKKAKSDPAAEEISLHAEILQMSTTAKQAAEPSRPSTRAALPWAPMPQIVEEPLDILPMESADISVPMAIVWSEDEPTPIAQDDRDILVIEDEVSVMVDGPASGVIGSGAMRQPAVKVDQQYQSLFSRLRAGQ